MSEVLTCPKVGERRLPDRIERGFTAQSIINELGMDSET